MKFEKRVNMNLKCTSGAFCFFVLSLISLSANSPSSTDLSANTPTPKYLRPMGVTTQPSQIITYPQAPRVSGWANYFFTSDFIYWMATADSYQFAASGVPTTENGNIDPPTSLGRTPSPAFAFEPGFKLGAGLKFPHDGWDFYANYTWLYPAKVRASLSSSDGHMIGPADPYWGSPTLSYVKNSFQQSFNIIDLELGRQFFVSRFLTLRPYFGLKTALIYQHQRNYLTVFNDDSNGLDGNAGSSLVPTGDIITNLIQKVNVKSWGMGIRGGFAPVWYFMKDFGLYGNLAISCLWTYFQNHLKTEYSGIYIDPITAAVSPIGGITGLIGRVFHAVTPVIELGLGLTYMTFFRVNERALTLSAGWEEQVWIGFNGGLPGGNLSLQGFTIKASYEF
jgi:hypothetical protein